MMSTGESIALVTEDSINNAIQKYRAKTGRPTKYTDELAAEIVQRLTSGETLRSVCRDAHVPDNPTIYDWMDNSPAFASAIARARKRQAPGWIEEGKEILDDADDQNGNAPVLKADKRAAYRMKMAQLWDPETFGDRSNVVHSGGQVHYHFDAGTESQPPAINVTPSQD